MLELIVQQLLNGIALGGIYGLAALGLTLVYGILYQANFAHAEQYVLAGYVLFFCLAAGIPFAVAALLAVLLGGIIGFLFSQLLWRPAIDRPHATSVLIFFGACLVLSSLVTAFYSPQAQAVSVPVFSNPVSLGGIQTTLGRGVVIIVSLVLLFLTHLLVTRTRIGTAMRAMAQDHRSANLMGINIYNIGMITFVSAGLLAGVAGILIVPLYGVVAPGVGFWMVIRAFCIILLGGRGNVPGTIAAAFLLGILESMFGGFVYAPLSNLIPWVTVIIVLWLRPQGVFGKAIRRVG